MNESPPAIASPQSIETLSAPDTWNLRKQREAAKTAFTQAEARLKLTQEKASGDLWHRQR